MSIFQYWGLYWAAKALAEQQHQIGVALLDGQRRLAANQHRLDLDEKFWDYSARLHLRLAEEFPDIDNRRIAKVATQLAVELLELDKLESSMDLSAD